MDPAALWSNGGRIYRVSFSFVVYAYCGVPLISREERDIKSISLSAVHAPFKSCQRTEKIVSRWLQWSEKAECAGISILKKQDPFDERGTAIPPVCKYCVDILAGGFPPKSEHVHEKVPQMQSQAEGQPKGLKLRAFKWLACRDGSFG